jgi:hypothetical protein
MSVTSDFIGQIFGLVMLRSTLPLIGSIIPGMTPICGADDMIALSFTAAHVWLTASWSLRSSCATENPNTQDGSFS